MGEQVSESVKVGTGKGAELIAFNIGSQEFCISTTSVREIRGWTPATPLPHAPAFVLGAWNASYGLGTFGVDPATNTAWAVVNHAGRFAVARFLKPPGHFEVLAHG